MPYLGPKCLNEARLECLKLAAEYVGTYEAKPDEIVEAARRFETYLTEGN
ncbi:hypothetical protein AB0F17_43230 [Nonomuraea sp. NPDC026600]